MWSKGVALASKTSVKASARLCRKLQRCPIPRCFSLATKVMHIINPYTCNTLRRFVHVYMDFRSSTGRLYYTMPQVNKEEKEGMAGPQNSIPKLYESDQEPCIRLHIHH